MVLAMDEVVQRLREMVTARFYLFAEALKRMDFAQLGVVTQEEFRSIIHQLAFRLMDQQVRDLLLG